MPRKSLSAWIVTLLFAFAAAAAVRAQNAETQPGRDPQQQVDQEYTEKIHKYTTEPFFLSPLVDYLPSSKSVATPQAALEDVAGAPGILPYAEDVYKYM